MRQVKKIFGTLTIGLFMFIGCQNSKSSMTNNDAKEDSLTTFDNRSLFKSNADSSDFQTFWGQFREAVLTNDTSKIISWTKLPIEAKGVLDSDPIIKYGQNEFTRIFKDFLKQPTGTNISDLNESQIDLIKTTEKSDLGIAPTPEIQAI
jgi:hypothetical protein